MDDETDWLDITTVGSAFEVQLDPRSGARRHRILAEPPVESGRINYVPGGGWSVGPAPKP